MEPQLNKRLTIKIKKISLDKLISTTVFITLVVSIIFVIYRIITAPSDDIPADNETKRLKSDYALMLMQCTLGLFIMLLPGLISKKLRIEIPNMMHIMFVIFLYCAIYLGEVRSFYYQFRNWDVLLHGIGGAMLGALGFSFVTFLNKSERVPVNLSPLFIALFAFCFAIMLGVLWEIYEYLVDGLLGLNMQKFALEDGTLLIGRAALNNTMKDLIVDNFGALAMSILGYVSLKYKKGWIEKLLIRKRKQG